MTLASICRRAAHSLGRRVLEHEAQAIGRIGRIERDVGAARLEDGEQANDHVEAALDADRDPVVGTDAEAAQVASEAVGTAVHRMVGQGSVLEHQGGGVGAASGLRLEQLMNAGSRKRRRRVVPGLQQQRALIGAEEVDALHRLVGVGDHGPQQSQ
jgi:hypothetical protein